jgi:transcriptional regulator with XRE-family HTH domain
MSIGNNLRRLRGQSKKSQQEIADLLEIDRRTYINWENEENDVKSEYIPKLAEIFNVEIKDLFQDSPNTIHIKQENKENKDHSINGVIFVLTDKTSIDKLAEVLRNNLEKK